MIRLFVLVEGQTEETFFNLVLMPHLASFGVDATVRQLGHSPVNPAKGKGGWTSYQRARKDIVSSMKQQPGAWHSTMVDFYKIPRDFPGLFEVTACGDAHARVDLLEQSWKRDVVTDHYWRFIPHIQLHEFEALIFADPQKLESEFLEHVGPIDRLVALSRRTDPELIDDGELTAPSKRIIREIPQYAGRKASAGPSVANRIGLPTLRSRCPHFDRWVGKLEELSRS